MSADLLSLIENEIPEGRQNLESSYANLERVAAYCEANYLQATDKQAALEETKRYTVQSLASVAYQINTLASNLLQMLDLQVDKLQDMESQVNNISQIVDIHKEKVARREIGVLTTNKAVTRQHKIVAPAAQERPQRYTRRPIDYDQLDDMGHGVRQHHNMRDPKQLITRTGSTMSVSSRSSGSTPHGQGAPAHFVGMQQEGHYGPGGRFPSLSKASGKEYRIPVTAQPPVAPPEQIYSRYPYLIQTQQQVQQRRDSVGGSSMMGANYSAVNVARGTLPRDGNMTMDSMMYQQQHSHGHGQHGNVDDLSDLPPPPIDFMAPVAQNERDSPPLPPPPPTMGEYGMVNTSSWVSRVPVPDWVPPNYIDKVVALFDYQADKEDELSFAENAIIYVLRKNEDGWFEGVLDGVTGLFPGNYVDSCI